MIPGIIAAGVANSVAPINVINVTSGIGTSDPQATSSVSPTAGSLLILTVVQSAISGFPADSLTVSGLSGTWMKVGTVAYATRRRCWLFTCNDWSGSGTISMDGSSVQELGWVLDEAQNAGWVSVVSTGGAGESTSATQTFTLAQTTLSTLADATYSSLVLENNTDATPEAGWTALGETTTGSLGVRRIETAWDSDVDISSAWTWGGSFMGNAGFICTLHHVVGAPSIASVGTALSATATAGATLTVPLPAGTMAGDICVTVAATNATDNTFTHSTNDGVIKAGTNPSYSIVWKRLVGGDSDPTVARAAGTVISSTNGLYGRNYIIRGAKPSGTPFVSPARATETGSGTAISPAGFTSTAANELAMLVVVAFDDVSWLGSPPAGWARVARTTSTTGGDATMDIVVKEVAAAGSVEGTITNVVSWSVAETWAALLIEFLRS